MKAIRVSQAHCEILADMHAKCFDKAWTKAEFEKLLLNKFYHVIMIADGEEDATIPMGFVMYHELDKESEIITICTLPKFRNKGVAQKLMSFIKSKKIFLEVDETNLDAIALYKTLGFNVEKIRENYYSNGNDALLMAKAQEINLDGED